jgi:hypothetical protein
MTDRHLDRPLPKLLGVLLGAAMTHVPPWNESLHQARHATAPISLSYAPSLHRAKYPLTRVPLAENIRQPQWCGPYLRGINLKRLLAAMILTLASLVGVGVNATPAQAAYPSCSSWIDKFSASAICSGAGAYRVRVVVRCVNSAINYSEIHYGPWVGKNTVSTTKCPYYAAADWSNALLAFY